MPNAGLMFCCCIFVQIALAFFPLCSYNRCIPGFVLQTTAQGCVLTDGGMPPRTMQDKDMNDAGG